MRSFKNVNGEEKEHRKGKQVELLMFVIMRLPGRSISKAPFDTKLQVSKTTHHQAEWMNVVSMFALR